uniref:G-protein coupled receptors family 2 profile 2 domain-containing protein n=1 Tax=Denticeps clupeoides TaxID=299321 RepID=A0AAY4EN10_9TELE
MSTKHTKAMLENLGSPRPPVTETKRQDLKKVLSLPPYPGEFLHPVVYACTAVMLLCLFASIITYIVHHSAIRISRKGWHMLLNFCFHTALTFAVFAGGINRTKHPIICQAVGVVLHYSSLSTMLWLGVTARNIYKLVIKKPPQTQDGDAPPHAQKQPMLRFYLVSGGVPFIICGITAATNIENYGSGEQTPYCWMAWEPSLGAFYGPVAFIVLVTCIYFLCAFIQLRHHPERKYELKALSEEQQRLASADLPHHCHQGSELGAPAGGRGGHCHGTPCCPGGAGLINPSLLANEHSFKAQLRTAAFTLFLFLATWTFGALAVSVGHFLDMIFSCLYGAFSVTLGLFVLIHHCAKRDDVWHCWCSCCPGRQQQRPPQRSGSTVSAMACHNNNGSGSCSAHGHIRHGRPKLNVNGDTLAHGHHLHAHCAHVDSPCPGKALLSNLHAPCKLGNLQAVAAIPPPNTPCLSPGAVPCCAALHSQQLLEEEEEEEDDEEPPAHVLLHAHPEGCRPAIHLHRCLKGSGRTKIRHFGRHRGSVGGSERDCAYHIPSGVDVVGGVGGSGSGHSSRAGSPHSMLECHTGHLCHLATHEATHEATHSHPHLEGHHSCHAGLCHPRHICCTKAELFPMLCQADVATSDAGAFLCGCGKMAASGEEELGVAEHLEMHSRRQSYPQNTPPNQNGILKGSLHEGFLYPSDSTGNIRTGPWRNETTV